MPASALDHFIVAESWDEELHPRIDAGNHGGGEFRSKLLSSIGDLAKGSAGPTTSVRNLISGSPEERDRALKSAYEGHFGNLEARVTSTGTRDGAIWAEGTIHDRTGKQVGNFGRTIGVEADGHVWADHRHVEIDPGVQGAGFANEFNGNAVDWYRRAGVHGVKLTANQDVGGYAWAAQGFDFQPGDDLPVGILKGLRTKVQARQAGKKKDDFGGDVVSKKLGKAPNLDQQFADAAALLERAKGRKPGDPGYPTAYEVSQLGRWKGAGRDDMWLGKEIMLGSKWFGQLLLGGDAHAAAA